jgi:hypothetical protein
MSVAFPPLRVSPEFADQDVLKAYTDYVSADAAYNALSAMYFQVSVCSVLPKPESGRLNPCGKPGGEPLQWLDPCGKPLNCYGKP